MRTGTVGIRGGDIIKSCERGRRTIGEKLEALNYWTTRVGGRGGEGWKLVVKIIRRLQRGKG